MGVGAYLQILNGTPYTFTNTDPSNTGYQMHSWDPSASIAPGTSDFSYFEFNDGATVTESDTQVTSTYTVGDTGYSFSIRAVDAPPRLFARVDGFSTSKMPEGEWLALGFVHNGSNPFVLTGTVNNMLSGFAPTDWMHQNLATLGGLPLKQICMPGSHDAGMGVLNPDGAAQDASAALGGGMIQTQPTTIYQQLVNGSRYLDVRPVMAGEGDFRAGHFSSNSTLGEIGCYGQSMSDIVSDINKFTQQYAELIILDLSHGYDSTNDYNDLSVSQWSTLFTQLTQDLSNLALINADYTTGLVFNNTLNSFIGNGTASVIVCLDVDGIVPDASFQGKGIFSQANLLTYNSYSNTMDADSMDKDQISKLENYPKNSSGQIIDQLHLVSWTLTPQSLTDPSIQSLATTANLNLFKDLLGACTQSAFPNIILVDWIENTNTAALAMTINNKVYGNAASANTPSPTQQYISALTVQASNASNFFPTGTCVDVSPDQGSPDCNNGFSGEYTYVVKSFTTDPSQAITGLSIDITGDSNPALGDMANGTGGDFRYVITSQNLTLPIRISDVQLWRSPDDPVTLADAVGWDGISTDINHGRSGAYLYLVWKNAQV
ncbi:PLC-like phosphodiesterase [Fusarium venenatum]|uniref:PLC-like phosphodiesterase n=1 Tax=Fusarium venenatum TaxID=56646 RepID=UPI001DF63DBA|nr:PLC-like phosphodiesterase [Fusarium venenatum]